MFGEAGADNGSSYSRKSLLASICRACFAGNNNEGKYTFILVQDVILKNSRREKLAKAKVKQEK